MPETSAVNNADNVLAAGLELVHKHNPRIIAIVGPTATGKSDLAIALAKALIEEGRTEESCTDEHSAKASSIKELLLPQIINADSYARYKYMDIGTAKVGRTEREQLEQEWGVKHYQVDVLDPRETSTAQNFAECVKIDIDEIFQMGNPAQNASSSANGIARGVPILCGGSGLYVRSVLDGFAFQKQDDSVRKTFESRLAREGVRVLYDELRQKSPETAAQISPQNARRVVRALEAFELTGAHTASLPQYVYAEPRTLQIGLEAPREVLDQRIEARTQKMRQQGLLDEVQQLYADGMLGETAIKAIGYGEAVEYFRGQAHPGTGRTLDANATYELIATHTKRLVRRQLSWFKRDPRIHWLQV